MTKLRVFSDVHNEIRRYYMNKKVYKPWVPKELEDDANTILILAGDIDHAKQLPTYIAWLAKRFKAVIHVAGNHEYYGSNIHSADRYMQEIDLIPNAYHLNNKTVTIDGQHFVGTTMWTDLTGREYPVMQAMNDYRQIRMGGSEGYRRITAMDTTRFFKRAYAFLANSITKDSIVITHHQPLSPGNMRMPNPYSPVETDTDYAYYACLQKEITEDWKPKAWIAGHTHSNHHIEDYFGTDLITNCVGYLGEEDYDENSLFEF
jgi:Icc-related predicted phosphoesterase